MKETMKESFAELKETILQTAAQNNTKEVSGTGKKKRKAKEVMKPEEEAGNNGSKLFGAPANCKKNRGPVKATCTRTGFNINPSKKHGNVISFGKTHVPPWLGNTFKLTNDMYLTEEETQIATYMFHRRKSQHISENDVFISPENGYCQATRQKMNCLIPKQLVDDEIISLAACMMTHTARQSMSNANC
ncbi:hypothetical protein L195_g041538, partial [Trifolium pratense]